MWLSLDCSPVTVQLLTMSDMKCCLSLLFILSCPLILPAVSTTPPPHCQSILEGGYSCVSTAVHTVSIGTNGTDEPHCITDDTVSCESLYYTLNQINLQTSTPNTTWLVLISSDQFVSSRISILFNIQFSCLVLCGTSSFPPTISYNSSSLSPLFIGGRPYSLASLILSNLIFDFEQDIDHISISSFNTRYFESVSISNVIITNSADWRVSSNAVSISNTSLYGNYYSAALLYLTVHSAVLTNVNVTGTYANTDAPNRPYGPIFIYSTITGPLVWIENCTFHNSSITKPDPVFQVYGSSLVLALYALGSRVVVSNCDFGYAYFISFATLYIDSYNPSVQLSTLSMHDIHYEMRSSLGHIFSVSYSGLILLQHFSFTHNSGTGIKLECESCILDLSNCSFSESEGQVLVAESNVIRLRNISIYEMTNDLFSETALINIEETEDVYFYEDISIWDNIGTAMKVASSWLTFQEGAVVRLVNNTGKNGGGMHLDELSFLVLSSFGDIKILNNTAASGGGIFIDLVYHYHIYCEDVLEVFNDNFGNITIRNNNAITKGNQVLFDFGSHPPLDIKHCNLGDLYTAVYAALEIGNITVFPGEKIKFDAINNDICEATLYVTCSENNGFNSCPFSISGSSKVIIPGGNNTVTTDLQIKTNINLTYIDTDTDFKLHAFCTQVTATAPLIIKNCTLGFTYNASDASCHGCHDCDPSLYQYSIENGDACVRINYWYGMDGKNNPVVVSCFFPFCKNTKTCLIKSVQPYTYRALPESQDDQCILNKGKVLCRQCSDGYHFTYLGLQCVRGTNCGWNLLGLILLAIVINFIIGLLWIGIIKFRGGLTFGMSLGPLIFIAFGNLIPFGIVPSFQPLWGLFSLLSLIIFDNRILGFIPVCTPISTGVGQQLLNYIGPLVIIVMILSIVVVTNCCPRYSNKLFDNPLQVICLLALVTFWSLARTSINLLLPLKVGNSYRFFVDPNIHIGSYYALVWLIAIPILIIVITVIVFMAVSPFLSRRFNTIRIKPILDVFHSSYKDKWRWYCSVYFASWVFISFFFEYNSTFLIAVATFLCVSVAHFIIQPYSFKWFNIVDTILLFDIYVLYTINLLYRTVEGDVPVTMITLMVYVLAVLPPLCYTIVFATILLNKVPCIHRVCKKTKRRFRRRSSMETQIDRHKTYTNGDHVSVSKSRVGVFDFQAFEEDGEPPVIMKRESILNY